MMTTMRTMAWMASELATRRVLHGRHGSQQACPPSCYRLDTRLDGVLSTTRVVVWTWELLDDRGHRK